jgi:hypothetical protein
MAASVYPRNRFDLFVCGGSAHVGKLKALLPKLRGRGAIHLGSSFFTPDDVRELDGLYDVLHEPRHSSDPYRNFELFSIRDIHRLMEAPYFIKLDADVQLSEDWLDYVTECLTQHPDVILFGPRKGEGNVTLELAGPLVRELLGREIQIREQLKVIGGFYVGQTSFFKQRARFMDLVHELLWCFEDGRRIKPSPRPESWPNDPPVEHLPFTVSKHGAEFRTRGNEDTLRNLAVHALASSEGVRVIDSNGRIVIRRDFDDPAGSLPDSVSSAERNDRHSAE